MIVKVQKPLAYGKYFLAFEAPGDDDETNTSEATPKRRVKIVDVKPANLSDKRRVDFTQGANEENEAEDTDTTDDSDMPIVDDDEDIDFSDIGDDDSETEPNEDTDSDGTDTEDDTGDTSSTDSQETDSEADNDSDTDQAPDVPDTGDDDDFTDGAGDDTGETSDDSSDDQTDSSDSEADTAGDDQPDTGDDTDFTDGSDESGDDESADDSGSSDDSSSTDTNTDTGTGNGAGVDYDSTRKYRLFKEYVKLSNSIEGYISKLENAITSNPQMNQIYKTSTEKLRDIRELLVDYMMMRYGINSYVQSLIFFNSQVAAVELIFSIINKAQAELKKQS